MIVIKRAPETLFGKASVLPFVDDLLFEVFSFFELNAVVAMLIAGADTKDKALIDCTFELVLLLL